MTKTPKKLVEKAWLVKYAPPLGGKPYFFDCIHRLRREAKYEIDDSFLPGECTNAYSVVRVEIREL